MTGSRGERSASLEPSHDDDLFNSRDKSLAKHGALSAHVDIDQDPRDAFEPRHVPGLVEGAGLTVILTEVHIQTRMQIVLDTPECPTHSGLMLRDPGIALEISA